MTGSPRVPVHSCKMLCETPCAIKNVNNQHTKTGSYQKQPQSLPSLRHSLPARPFPGLAPLFPHGAMTDPLNSFRLTPDQVNRLSGHASS